MKFKITTNYSGEVKVWFTTATSYSQAGRNIKSRFSKEYGLTLAAVKLMWGSKIKYVIEKV